MKVLIVRNSPTIINLNNYNVQEIGLAKALMKKGQEVGIVFYTDKDYREEMIDGINFYWIPAKKIINYSIFDKKIYDVINDYDIIQTSEYNQIMSYKIAKKYPNKTIIYHGPYYRKSLTTKINNKIFDTIFLKKYLKLNSTIMTKSYLAEEFLKNKGFNNVITVGVGLDVSKFNESKENKYFINNIDKNNFNIVCIGTIEKRKNTYFLLQVLNELIKINKKYNMIFIGKPIDKYKNKCLKYIKINNLKDNVLFIDNMKQEELKSVYLNTDLFILASTYEIFGMVLLEAIYFNVPILSSLNGGSSFLLDKKYIMNNFNKKEWMDKILKLDKKKIKYNKKILWKEIVDKFISNYEGVLENGKTKK